MDLEFIKYAPYIMVGSGRKRLETIMDVPKSKQDFFIKDNLASQIICSANFKENIVKFFDDFPNGKIIPKSILSYEKAPEQLNGLIGHIFGDWLGLINFEPNWEMKDLPLVTGVFYNSKTHEVANTLDKKPLEYFFKCIGELIAWNHLGQNPQEQISKAQNFINLLYQDKDKMMEVKKRYLEEENDEIAYNMILKDSLMSTNMSAQMQKSYNIKSTSDYLEEFLQKQYKVVVKLVTPLCGKRKLVPV